MAQFYATMQGSRGEASRLGTKASGIRVSVKSWEGEVNVHMHHNAREGRDWVFVCFGPHGGGKSITLYSGPASYWTKAELIGTLGRQLVEYEQEKLLQE